MHKIYAGEDNCERVRTRQQNLPVDHNGILEWIILKQHIRQKTIDHLGRLSKHLADHQRMYLVQETIIDHRRNPG